MAGSDAGPGKTGPNEFLYQVSSFSSFDLKGFGRLMGLLRLGRGRWDFGYGLGIRNCLVPLSDFCEQLISYSRIVLYQ